MEKPFKTYRQQITILRNRNMIVNGTRAMRILRSAGYYNVINGYKDIFIDTTATKQNGEDIYKAGTTLDQVYALYSFDCAMRNILISYLLKAETTIKTKSAYYFSEAHNNEFAYLNINNYDLTNPPEVTKLIAKLSNIITQNTSNKGNLGQIDHYISKYRAVPLWVLSQKMTFGEIKHFIKSLDPIIKKKFYDEVIHDFTRSYSIRFVTPSTIEQDIMYMLDILNDFRNICAHGNRLYNRIFKKGKHIPPISTLFHSPYNLKFNSKLFDCILITGLFISKKEYTRFIKDISEEIENLQSELSSSQFNIVLMNMGFAKDWKEKIKL